MSYYKSVVKLDWLSFTWGTDRMFDSSAHMVHEFCNVFKGFDFLLDSELSVVKGLYGYEVGVNLCKGLWIMWSTKQLETGIHVQCSSMSLKELAFYLGLEFDETEVFGSAQKMLSVLSDGGCRFARIDLACDDFNKTFTPSDYRKWQLEGRIRTNFKNGSACWSVNDAQGDTFYLGKRGGNKMLRIYDKNYESNGQVDCIRYEFEFRHRAADQIGKFIADRGYCNFSDLLLDHIEVLDEYSLDGDYNSVHVRKCRTSVMRAWEHFVKHELNDGIFEQKVVFDLKKRQPTTFERLKWGDACYKSYLKVLKAFEIYAEESGKELKSVFWHAEDQEEIAAMVYDLMNFEHKWRCV